MARFRDVHALALHAPHRIDHELHDDAAAHAGQSERLGILRARRLDECGNALDDVKRGMLGSTALHNRSRVGVAWESYGLEPGDTATIAVNIVSVAELGRLRTAGIVLGLVTDPRSAVGVRWTEPSQRRTRVSTTSTVTALHYPLTVDLGKLAAGNYMLEVATESASCGVVKAERVLSISR